MVGVYHEFYRAYSKTLLPFFRLEWHSHTGLYVVSEISKVIVFLDVEKVGSITENAFNMKSAWRILNAKTLIL